MKNLTIKALILSLSVLFIPNTKCAYINITRRDEIILGVVVGTAVVGIVGGVIYLCRKTAKCVSSLCRKIKKKKISRVKRKSQKLPKEFANQ